MPTADDIIKALTKLAATHVLVGIPSDSHREDDAVSNALLGYVHEMGSPVNNVPARPFLRPGVEKSKDEWEPYMRQAAAAALKGDDGVMGRALDAAGQTAVDAVKDEITQGIPPPIKPESMAQRRRYQDRPELSARERRKRSGQREEYRGFYERYEAGIETKPSAGGVTPLVDTSQLLNSITYVVKTG